jgi:hypothetical protein
MLLVKKKIKNLAILIPILLVGIVALVAILTHSEISSKVTIVLAHATYPADFSDDRVLVGAAHNVFVGKVAEQIGTKERGIGPETQFEVEIIENIKGELERTVIVNQQGGYKDGKLYLMEGDTLTFGNDEESLLQIGSTYLFSTRYNENKDWYTLMSYPTANKVLTDDKRKISAELKTLAERDSRVQELKDAYPRERHLKADIENNNLRNSYDSRQMREDLLNADEPMATSTDVVLEDEILDETSATTSLEISAQESVKGDAQAASSTIPEPEETAKENTSTSTTSSTTPVNSE